MAIDLGSGGGTNVGSGCNLTVKDAVVAGGKAGVDVVDDDTPSVLLSIAQPPTVAASDAAVINILTPGAPDAGRPDDFDGGMSVSPK